jgi:hypothetical protein
MRAETAPGRRAHPLKPSPSLAILFKLRLLLPRYRKQPHRLHPHKSLWRKDVPRIQRHHVCHEHINILGPIGPPIVRASPHVISPTLARRNSMRRLHLHPRQLSPRVHNHVVLKAIAPRRSQPVALRRRLRQKHRLSNLASPLLALATLYVTIRPHHLLPPSPLLRKILRHPHDAINHHTEFPVSLPHKCPFHLRICHSNPSPPQQRPSIPCHPKPRVLQRRRNPPREEPALSLSKGPMHSSPPPKCLSNIAPVSSIDIARTR